MCISILAKSQEEIPTYICTGLIFLTDLCISAHTSVVFVNFSFHSAGLCSSTIQCFHFISVSTYIDICSSCHNPAFLHSARTVSPEAFITCTRQQALAALSFSFISFKIRVMSSSTTGTNLHLALCLPSV